MTEPRAIAPFPWSSLEATTKADVRALSELRRWLQASANLDKLAAAIEAIVASKVDIRAPRRSDALAHARARAWATGGARGSAFNGGFACLLAAESARHAGDAVLLEAESALVATVVARALKRTTPGILDPSQRPSSRVAGAFTAILTAALHRAHAHSPVRIIAAGASEDLARDLALGGDTHFVVPLTVTVDDTAYVVRATLPRGMVPSSPPETWSRVVLEGLGDIPLAIPMVIASTLTTAGDLASLQVGDAFLPGVCSVKRAATGALVGTVLLAASGEERALRAELGADGRLILSGLDGTLPLSPPPEDTETTMSTGDEKPDTLSEAIGEVPVVVRVEIGTAEMRARDWAALGPGDVLALGKKIGEKAVLRVGGVEVARGELVDVDGEIGVRIVERREG